MKIQVNRKLLPIKAHFFFFFAALGPILPQLNVYGRQLGVSPAAMGMVTAVLPLLWALAKPLFGYVVDFWPTKRKLIFMLLIVTMSGSYCSLWFLPMPDPEPHTSITESVYRLNDTISLKTFDSNSPNINEHLEKYTCHWNCTDFDVSSSNLTYFDISSSNLTYFDVSSSNSTYFDVYLSNLTVVNTVYVDGAVRNTSCSLLHMEFGGFREEQVICSPKDSCNLLCFEEELRSRRNLDNVLKSKRNNVLNVSKNDALNSAKGTDNNVLKNDKDDVLKVANNSKNNVLNNNKEDALNFAKGSALSTDNNVLKNEKDDVLKVVNNSKDDVLKNNKEDALKSAKYSALSTDNNVLKNNKDDVLKAAYNNKDNVLNSHKDDVLKSDKDSVLTIKDNGLKNTKDDGLNTQDDALYTKDDVRNTKDDVPYTKDVVPNTKDDVLYTKDDVPNTQADVLYTKENVLNGTDEVKSDNFYMTATFWAFVVLMCVGTVAFNVANCIGDAVCFDVLGDQGSKYGAQRAWGTAGYGLTALAGGWLIDLVSGHDYKNFTPAFVIIIVATVVDLYSCRRLHLPSLSSPSDSGAALCEVLRIPRVVLFIIFAIVAGTFDSFIIYYMFWFLEELAEETGHMSKIKLIEGVVVAAQSFIGELIFFFYSGKIINRWGYGATLTFSLFCYGVRMALISLIRNPWHLVFIEGIMQGPTYALCYSTIVGYAAHVAPEGYSATVQGIVAGVDDGLGFAIGSLVGGQLYSYFGGRGAFRLFAIVAGAGALLHGILFKFVTRGEPKEKEVPEIEEDEKMLPENYHVVYRDTVEPVKDDR